MLTLYSSVSFLLRPFSSSELVGLRGCDCHKGSALFQTGGGDGLLSLLLHDRDSDNGAGGPAIALVRPCELKVLES